MSSLVHINGLDFQPLVAREHLARAVKDLAARLNQRFAGKKVQVVCVLTGAFVFVADLVRELHFPVTLHFVRASSYGAGMQSSGNVRIIEYEAIDPHYPVLIAEDVIDSGATLRTLESHYKSQGVGTIVACSMFRKPCAQALDCDLEVALEIGEEFVVGYGLDFAGQGRELADLYVLQNAASL